MVESILKIALENPTVESLTQTLQELVVAYKKLEAKCEQLEHENERLRRQLNNNSQNSSKPSSTDQKPTKKANTYNAREKSARKKGGQSGHAGKGLSKEGAQALINKGAEHQVVGVGVKSENYESRYVIDLKIRPVVTEFRFYKNKYALNPIPAALNSPVTYGPNIKSICALLYSEGVVANDRIQAIVNDLSGSTLAISTGAVYNICRSFVKVSKAKYDSILSSVLDVPVVATDSTNISVDGIQKYVRNFSTDEYCLYESQIAKSLECMKESAFLPNYEGILEHDHETALYNFGSGHGECNAHLFRYLKKNTEEAKSKWSGAMKALLSEAHRTCKQALQAGSLVDNAYIADVEARYDGILARGNEENKKTKGLTAKTEERRLLNRLKKYKKEHLLFLRDLRVPFTNNISERDLRKCKNRQKISGGFRSLDGCDMYCKIMSVVETWKREGKNLLEEMKKNFIAAMNIPCYAQAYL